MGSKEKQELERFKQVSVIALKKFSPKEQPIIARYWDIVKKEIKKIEKEDKAKGVMKSLDTVICPKCGEEFENE